jgi:hypothetical protein
MESEGLIERLRCKIGSSNFEYRPNRALIDSHQQGLIHQAPRDALSAPCVQHRQIHQPDFLEDDPITKVPDDRSRTVGFLMVLGQEKMSEPIARQFSFQHFARPGGREASLFNVQKSWKRFNGRRLDRTAIRHAELLLIRALLAALPVRMYDL